MRRGTAGALGVAMLAAAAAAAPATGSPSAAGTASVAPNTPSTGAHLLLDAKGLDGGFRDRQLPAGFSIGLAKGFVVDATAVPGVCTAKQADAQQCPEDSRLGAGAIGVDAYGPIYPPGGQHLTAKLAFFRADPPTATDAAGIAFTFQEPQSGYSGSAIGAIRAVDQGDYGTVLAFDHIPLPDIGGGFSFTVDHLQLDLGAGSASSPVAAPKKKPKAKKRKAARKHHVVRLRCTRYAGRRGHRHCVRYAHRKAAPKAHKSAATSFIVTPPACTGSWPVQITIAYKDGQEQREATAPCSAPAAR